MASSLNVLVLVICCTLVSFTTGLSFRNQPDVVTAYAGETIYMRCDLNLDPRVPASSVSVTWIKSDNRNAFRYISIRGHIVQAYADPERFSIAGDSNLGEHDLMISKVQYDDAGMYWCQASGSGQIIESAAGRLTVQVPIPIPTCSMNPPSPLVGQRVTFNCEQQMHPSVNYEALNWWNETSRTKMLRQGRYSDGSIYFMRILTENDRNQRFVCSQGSSFVEGQRNCTIVPLPAIEVSTIATNTIVVNPEIKYVAEGGSATFSCRSNGGAVTRWVFGYGSRASKIRETRNRFLLTADRSELTVIRTTLNDNGTAVRCIVITSSGEKLVGQSMLTVLSPTTQAAATNPIIPPPPPPDSTFQPAQTEQPIKSTTRKTSTPRKDTTINDPSTKFTENTPRGSQPNSSDGKTHVSVHTTDKTTLKTTTIAVEPTTRRDVVQIGANTDIDAGLEGTEANVNQNHADTSSKVQTGGGYRADPANTHQVSNQEKAGQSNSNSGVLGAVLGSLLIIALLVLIIFLIKTKRYPKSVPTWIPPHVVSALKRPIDMVKRSGAEGGRGGDSDKSGKGEAAMRMRQIEVVVNPPPPEWQFRLKDVENGNTYVGIPPANISPRKSHIMDGPVYANLSPELSKSHLENELNEMEDEEEDNDSLFSSDFDDDLDLEGEIAAEMLARSNDSMPRCVEGNSSESVEEKKSKNVEGLVYAQLDLGPDAEKRSTVFIEGEKTQYAHIHVGSSRGK